MLGSSTIDLLIGMAVIFVMLSLVCSAVREAIEARLKSRSWHLAAGIRQLLSDDKLTAVFYRHPLVKALYHGDYEAPRAGFKGYTLFRAAIAVFRSLHSKVNLPSYIPARTFALTMLSIAREQGQGDASAAASPPGLVERIVHRLLGRQGETPPSVLATLAPTVIDEVRAALKTSNESWARSMSAALAAAGSDVDAGVKAIEDWYNGSMDRVAGWYKRESQHLLFWIGLVVAVALNVDTLLLVKFLSQDQAARAQLLGTAEEIVSSKTYADDMEKLRLAKQGRNAKTGSGVAAGVSAPARSAYPASASASTAPADAAASAVSPGASSSAAAAQAASKPASSAAPRSAVDLQQDIDAADAKVHDAVKRLTDLNLPVGWTTARWNDFSSFDRQSVSTVVGWLLTAFAMSFGAPFWFDVLNKIMVIRSTVKPREKSQDEGSEDRQNKGKAKTTP